MTTYNGGPLSLGPIMRDRLKNLKDVDKGSSLSLCLPVRGISVPSAWGVGSVKSTSSPVVYGDIVLSINTQ